MKARGDILIQFPYAGEWLAIIRVSGPDGRRDFGVVEPGDADAEDVLMLARIASNIGCPIEDTEVRLKKIFDFIEKQGYKI